jgi:hypothetical protein
MMMDEGHPAPRGHRWEQFMFGYASMANMIWWMFVALFTGFMYIDMYNEPLALPILLIISFVVTALLLSIHVFWIAPGYDKDVTFRFHRKCDNGSRQEEYVLTSNQKQDRVLRAAMDQWQFTVVLFGVAFVLLFLLIFWAPMHMKQLQPLPIGATLSDLENYNKIKGFQMATVAIAFFVILIFFCPIPSVILRIFMAVNDSYKNEHRNADGSMKEIPVNNQYFGVTTNKGDHYL